MANRIGTRGGAVRPNRLQLAQAGGPVATPTAGGGAAAAWGIIARSTGQLAEVAHRRYDAQVAAQSHEAGIMDAIMGRVRKLDRSTTRGGSYMDAALSTTKLMAETNAAVRLSELYQENPNNPAALQEAIMDYAEGAVGEVAGIDPGSALELRARIVTQAIPMINGAVSNLEAKTAAFKKDQIARAEDAQQVIVAQNAPNVFSPDPGQSQAATAALIGAQNQVASFQSEEAADGFLIERLASGHDAAHIVNMQPELKTRLAAMIEGAPEGIREKLGIYSGYRSIARQRELWEQSDKSGRRVARPGSSEHNHGNAADLTYDGKPLDDAPAEVIKWMHENAATFGLKFPLKHDPKEAHHIETQETRGGEAFTGKVGVSGFSTVQQDVNDAVIGPGFLAHFQNQTDKPQAYLDFVAGTLELPMTLPDGRTLTVNVRNSLSQKMVGQIEADMRARMNFETGLREQAEKDSAAVATLRSDQMRAGMITGILAPGTSVETAEGTLTFNRPTEASLLNAMRSGDLEPDDYETLLKALRDPPAVTSDEDVKREAFKMILAGNDPQSFILENLSRITAEDAKQMVDYYATRTNTAGTLNAGQKFYIDQLEATFTQGMLDSFDTAKQERKVASVIEARARMLAGEPAKEVFEDISARAKIADAMEGLQPSPAVPRPRFAAPDPLNPAWIDPAVSMAAIEKAWADGQLSDEEFVRQKRAFRLFVTWQQQQQAAAQEVKP